MERLLAKLANQLLACDEASLMNLWNTYAIKVQEFEPTKEWEEATLTFCMIQSIVFKNQLFNYNLANEYTPVDNTEMPYFFPGSSAESGSGKHPASPSDEGAQAMKKKATLLRFPTQDK